MLEGRDERENTCGDLYNKNKKMRKTTSHTRTHTTRAGAGLYGVCREKEKRRGGGWVGLCDNEKGKGKRNKDTQKEEMGKTTSKHRAQEEEEEGWVGRDMSV